MRWCLSFLIGFSLSLLSISSLASTGAAGIALGMGTGLEGIDFSDGYNRTNIGGLSQEIHFGIHIQDFAFLVSGTFMDFLQGSQSLDNYLASGDVELKFYYLEDFYFLGSIGMAQIRRSASSGTTETLTTDFGGSTGLTAGWDVYAGNANSPFRLSINIGARRYDFGSSEVLQGTVASDTNLSNHINGLAFFGYLGFDWYL